MTAVVGAALFLAVAGRRATVPAVLAVAWHAAPALAVGGAVAWGAWALRGRWRARWRQGQITTEEMLLLVRLVGLGLGAGLPFPAAIARAADEVRPTLAAAVRRALRHGVDRWGEVEGPLRRLFEAAAVARRDGTPLLPAVDALAADLAAEERAAAVTAARRLPVRLLFPLTFLMLPGFVLITVGPTIVAGLRRLVM